MKPAALAALALLFGLAYAASSSAEESFAEALQRFSPEESPRVLELGEALTDPTDREAWSVFRAGIEAAPSLPVRPDAAAAVSGWLGVLAALSKSAPSGSPRRARLEFWRRLLPGFEV